MADSFQLIKTADIVSKTTGAYMFDDYGREHWINISCFLLDQGYSAAQVADLLLSKHMRWSSDMRGKATFEEFKRYFNKYHENIAAFFQEIF